MNKNRFLFLITLLLPLTGCKKKDEPVCQIDFRQPISKQNKKKFADLPVKQEPTALYIGCSDSRVVPHLIACAYPGDLFVLENVGNIVPPAKAYPQNVSAAAAIEYAVSELGVSNIVVCGHSNCGAMKALVEGIGKLPYPYVKSWLEFGKESLKRKREGLVLDSSLSKEDQVSQVNVLQQIEHIKTYPFVEELIEKNELEIHGWWFDLSEIKIFYYDEELHRFIKATEKDDEELSLML